VSALVGAFACLAWLASSCAPTSYVGSEILSSVRILATSADPAYAQPGQVVNVQMLAYDGRPAADRADAGMNLDWIAGCKDPANDAYFACYPPRGGAIFPVVPNAAPLDAGTPSDGGTTVCATLDDDAGVAAPTIGRASFTMPLDAVSAHPFTAGTAPYGLAFIFNMACAGDAGPLPISPSNINPQQIPFTCYDPSGKVRGPDEYVLGFNRVYAYAADAGPGGGPLMNQNPVIQGVDLPSDMSPPCFAGTPPSYVTGPITAKLCVPGGPCPQVQLGPIIPKETQEDNPVTGMRELVWVDYYSTFGSLSDSARLLADPTAGLITLRDKVDTNFQPPVPGPNDPHAGYIFLVVHDDRGGVSWVTVPVQLVP
jgi:hypothetical protein